MVDLYSDIKADQDLPTIVKQFLKQDGWVVEYSLYLCSVSKEQTGQM